MSRRNVRKLALMLHTLRRRELCESRRVVADRGGAEREQRAADRGASPDKLVESAAEARSEKLRRDGNEVVTSSFQLKPKHILQ